MGGHDSRQRYALYAFSSFDSCNIQILFRKMWNGIEGLPYEEDIDEEDIDEEIVEEDVRDEPR